MAEAIARAALNERAWMHVDVRSAGTGAVPGMMASREAMEVAREHGLDIDTHASQPLTAELVAWADLVLVMGSSHLHVVRDLSGEDKASLVTEFIDGEGHAQPVADPFGGDIEHYRAAFVQLEAAVAGLLDRLEPILSP